MKHGKQYIRNRVIETIACTIEYNALKSARREEGQDAIARMR